MIVLSDIERERFAAWLRQEAEREEEMSMQCAALGAHRIDRAYAVRASAKRAVAEMTQPTRKAASP